MAFVTEYLESVQYDGTNGSYICGDWSMLPLVSDDGTTLRVGGVDGDFQTATVGDWFIKVNPVGTSAWVVTNEQYTTRFREIA